MWNENFELSDGLYWVSDIKDYFEYIIKKHETVTDNPPITIYVNKIKIRITIKIKTKFYLLTHEPMKLLRGTKENITKNENGKNMHHSQISEAVLDHGNIVNNNYQHDSRILYTFVPNKSFGQLLDISPKTFMLLEI